MPGNHESRRWTALWRVAALGLMGLLAQGCATFPVVNAKSPIEHAPAASEGLVVMSITNNTGQITQFDRVVLTREQDKEAEKAQKFITYELRQISRGMSRDTAVFFGALPPGDYRFKQFWDDDRMLYLPLTPGGIELLGSFNVTAGKVSDIGRLVATSANTSMLVGRSTRAGSNDELLLRFVPQAATFYKGDIAAGWNQPRQQKDRVEEYGMLHPVGGSGLVELHNGEIAVASRLGTLLIRNTQGRWRAARTGQLESLLWIEPVSEGNTTLVASGELNTLVRLRTDNTMERIDVGDLPPGNIIFVSGSEARGWFIAHQQGDTVTLRSSRSLVQPKWEVVATERLPMSFWTGAKQIWFFRTGSGFGYANSKGEFHFYDAGAATWRTASGPTNSTLGIVDTSPNDIIGVLTQPGGFGGVFATAYLSRDGAKTWEKVEPELKVKIAAPKQTAGGTLLFFSNEFNWSAYKPKLQASSDGGKSWSVISDKLDVGSVIWPLQSGPIVSITSGMDGIMSIRRSSDNGVTWSLEYTSYERRP